MTLFKRGLVWLRRDLRLAEHQALTTALQECQEVALVFIFDKHLIDALKREMDFFGQPHQDSRLGYIYQSLQEIDQHLRSQDSQLIIRYGNQADEIEQVIEQYQFEKLYFHEDYEPQARRRDIQVRERLKKRSIPVSQFRDHILLNHQEVRTGSGDIYRVFTPYKRRWLEVFEQQKATLLASFNPHEHELNKLIKSGKLEQETPLSDQSFWQQKTGVQFLAPTLPGGRQWALQRLTDFSKKALSGYQDNRDFPAREGTSQLSVAIRHGVLSIKEMVRAAIKNPSSGAQVWLSELIWREFYQMILDTHPFVTERCFKPAYDHIQWRGDDELFQAWCQGKTGFPLVDAAMRGLNQTGQIHNRLRMVVGSFLCKTLLVDWRLGERYFALKLLDFDLAANNGGWQWCSSSGCDAQPYFRIFNPYTQSEKFDPEGEFIRLWCPELRELSSKTIHAPAEVPPLELAGAGITLGRDYPHPIVSYKDKRQEALEMYKITKTG